MHERKKMLFFEFFLIFTSLIIITSISFGWLGNSSSIGVNQADFRLVSVKSPRSSDGPRQINISISPATVEDDQVLKLELDGRFDYDNCQPSGEDIRFHDSSNNTIPYYIEDWNERGFSHIWLRIPNAGTSEITMSYGNESALPGSSGEDVFLFFDDFNDDYFNTSKWGYLNQGFGTIDEHDGYLYLRSDSDTLKVLSVYQKNGTFSGELIINIRCDLSIGRGDATSMMFGFSNFSRPYVSNQESPQICRLYSRHLDNLLHYQDKNGNDINTEPVPYPKMHDIEMIATSQNVTWHRDGGIASITQPGNNSLDNIHFSIYTQEDSTVRVDQVFVRKFYGIDCKATPDYNISEYTPVSKTIFLSRPTPIDNYSVRLDLNSSFNYQLCTINGEDISFRDADNNSLPYWIEKWNDGGMSIIWIRVLKAGTSNFTMEYGNWSDTSGSNGSATFDFFDDFKNNYLDSKLWDEDGGLLSIQPAYYAFSNGCINYISDGSFWRGFISKQDVGPNTSVEIRFSKDTGDTLMYMGFTDSLENNRYLFHDRYDVAEGLWLTTEVNGTSKMQDTGWILNDSWHVLQLVKNNSRDMAMTFMDDDYNSLFNYSSHYEFGTSPNKFVMTNFGVIFNKVDWIRYRSYSDVEPVASIRNENAPTLVSGNVTPSSGNQGDLFTFSVKFIDADDNFPVDIKLNVNGSSFTLTKKNPFQHSFINGCDYYTSLHFQPGDYVFNFSCSDGYFTNSTTNSTLTVSPVNNNPPYLRNACSSPNVSSSNTSLINFTVQYFDPDNNLPVIVNITINGTTFNMVEANTTDLDVIDGKLYYFNTSLNWGYYTYHVNCSDGVYSNSTPTASSIEVNPLLNLDYGYVIFHDDFESGSLGVNWSLTGDGGVDSRTSSSGSFSAYHDGSSGAITSKTLNLTRYSSVNISYWVRRGSSSFSEYPDAGEDFIVEYLNSTGSWVAIDTFLGGGLDGEIFTRNHVLPADAIHSGFQVRFRQTYGSSPGFDYWHLDDVLIEGNSSIVPTLFPKNNATLFSGMINFSWRENLDDFSDFNYTWQLSNTSDFSSILLEHDHVQKASETNSISQLITLPTGTYFWRVIPVYQIFNGNESDPVTIHLIYNENAPELLNDSDNLSSGDQFTVFNFTINYKDVDGNAPVSINLILNNTIYPMSKVNASDSNYSDGCLHVYSTMLAPGNYTYWFNCSDGKFTNNTSPRTLQVIESNFASPWLESPSVSPNITNSNGTLINFTAWYFDSDNNLPKFINISINNTVYPMVEVNSSDLNVTDGKLYYFTTTLNWGIYTYQVNCFDGMYSNSTAILVGPEVNLLQNNFNSTFFFENFEGNLSNWVRIDSPWHITDNSSVWPDQFHSPVRAMWCGEESSGLYPNNINAELRTIPIDLKHAKTAFLEIYTKYSIETLYDFILIDISTDGVNWNNIFMPYDYVGSWEKKTFDISSYCGYPSVQVRFVLRSDATINNLGWYIDDVKIYGMPSYEVSLISPGNNTSLTEDFYNFTWHSIENPEDNVNYTLQISNTSDFSFIIYEVRHIKETTALVSVNISLEFPTGTYYWRVRPDYLIFHGNWSQPFLVNITFPGPVLLNESIFPSNGTQLTLFYFSLVYKDPTNDPPAFMNLVINGTNFPMEKANLDDDNYTDGCTYHRALQLAPGNYTYHFSASDGKHVVNSSQEYALEVININPTPPSLINLGVDPTMGRNDSIFNFSVMYIDPDNNQPLSVNITINSTIYQMLPVNPLDTNYIDGAWYYFSTSLVNGYYQFEVTCFDGIYQVNSSLHYGPEVTPFYNSKNYTLFTEDFESGLSKWQVVNGSWHVTSNASSWPDPVHSGAHAIWFGNETTGTYDVGGRSQGDLISVPVDLSMVETAYLEFSHWRHCEPYYDLSKVYISIDGINWDEIQQYYLDVSPWEKVFVNISSYCGNKSILFKFSFDTADAQNNNYRGWLIDDIKVYSNLTMAFVELLSPVNDSIALPSTLMEFKWESLDLPIGNVNYTLEFSNDSDFSTVWLQDNGIVETPGNTSTSIVLPTQEGTYYWRVRANHDGLHSKWSKVASLNVLDLTPTANFTASTTLAGINQVIQFNFTGTPGNLPMLFQWDFGDNSTNSTLENPVHQYSTDGNYTVILTVVDLDGDQVTTIKANYIHVTNLLPQPDFVANVTVVGVNESIGFTYTGSKGDEPVTFQWDFGDNSTNSTLENPVHQYSTDGNYTVILTVIDANGDNATITKVGYIIVENMLPVANFTTNVTSTAPGYWVQFTYTGSKGDEPVTFQWDFGDGSSNSTLENPAHQYSTDGNYTVILTVIDANGDNDTIVKTNLIFVADLLPAASFTVNNTNVLVNDILQFNFTGIRGNSPTAFQWDFGDGSPNATRENPIHQYASSAIFNVTLTITDLDGDSDSFTMSINVSLVNEPHSNFTCNSTVILTGGWIQFNFTGDVGTPPSSFQWDFGDGSPNATVQDPIHQYINSGIYTVTLTVTDNNGKSDTWQRPSFIQVVDLLPESNFTANASSIKIGEWVQFIFTGIEGDHPTTFQWYFGDGTPMSGDRNPVHQYLTGGTFSVMLILIDGNGNSSSMLKTNYIEVIDEIPVANFTADNVVVQVNQAIQFSFTGFEGDAPATFQWNFGDGTANDTRRNPIHEYTSEGYYNVTLTVEDKNGDSNTVCFASYIKVEEFFAPPVILSEPGNMTVIKGKITVLEWVLSDNFDAGNYSLYEDGKLLISNVNWEIGVKITVVINTSSLTVGDHEYKLVYCDGDGEEGIPSIVTLTVKEKGSSGAIIEFFKSNWYFLVIIGAGLAIAIGLAIRAREKKVNKTTLKQKGKKKTQDVDDWTSRDDTLTRTPPDADDALAKKVGTIGEVNNTTKLKSFSTTAINGLTTISSAEPNGYYCLNCNEFYKISSDPMSGKLYCPKCNKPMTKVFSCPHCLKTFQVSQDDYTQYHNQSIKCPTCGKELKL
ncbi:MAG: DUF2341 domain-containing protein [Promethearchaeota archaeon]